RWLWSEPCPHHAPLACAVAFILWGPNASSDKLRASALHELRRGRRSSRIVMSALWQKRTFPPLSGDIDVLKGLPRGVPLPPESGHNVQLCSTLSLAKAESAPPFGMWRCVWIEKL